MSDAITLKSQLINAVQDLTLHASGANATRLDSITQALSQANIREDDHLKVAFFIFLLFAEMQELVKKNQKLKKLILDCDAALTVGKRPSSTF